MSFSRLALRLAAIEALCPTGGPYPTIAGRRVYDSRIDLVAGDDDLSAIEANPLISVYTEDQHELPYGSAKYPAAENVVTLVLELMLAIRGEVEIEHPDGSKETVGTLDTPATDRQHEALLDLLEAQAVYLLNPKNMAPTALVYSKVAWEIHSVHSDPQRAADRAVRLAARTVKLHIKVKKEEWTPFPVSPAPTGLDRLPEPMRSVAYAMPAGSSAAALCATLADYAPQPANPIPLDGINIAVSLGSDDQTNGFVPTL
jgi:hypothetical protein